MVCKKSAKCSRTKKYLQHPTRNGIGMNVEELLDFQPARQLKRGPDESEVYYITL